MRLPLFGLGHSGKSVQVNSASRINCYAEIQPEEDRAKLAFYTTPGLTQLASINAQPSRGLWPVEEFLYTVHGNGLYRVNSAGAVSALLGTLNTSSGPVDMADNGEQLIIVDGTNGYIYNATTGVFSVIGGGFPANVAYVVYQDTYFIASPDGDKKFYVSSPLDGLTWNALDFATTQASPDDVTRLGAFNNILHVFSEFATEFWQNSGGVDFPYSRISGAAAQFGLHAKWSLAMHSLGLAGLFQNRMGDFFAGIVNGMQVNRISNSEIESIWRGYAKSVDATGFAYLMAGHPFYELTFPTANATWLYDGASKSWSQLKDASGSRHWAQYFSHFDAAEKNVVSDYRTGLLYIIDSDSFSDSGSPIITEITGRHVFADEDLIIIDELELVMEKGVGTTLGQGSQPRVMLQVSKDGGKTYGPERWADMGALGQNQARARFLRLGSARDWTFKLKISDPVKRVITGASVNMRKAAS